MQAPGDASVTQARCRIHGDDELRGLQRIRRGKGCGGRSVSTGRRGVMPDSLASRRAASAASLMGSKASSLSDAQVVAVRILETKVAGGRNLRIFNFADGETGRFQFRMLSGNVFNIQHEDHRLF